MTDKLDGFRSRAPSSQEEQPVLTGEQAELVRVALMGSALEEWLSVHPGASFYKEAQDNLVSAINDLLAVDDLSSSEAKAAHYRARIAAGIMANIDTVLRTAHVAYQQLKEQEIDNEPKAE